MGVGGQNGSMAPAAISDWRKNGPNVHDIVKEQVKSITDDLKEQLFGSQCTIYTISFKSQANFPRKDFTLWHN